MTTTQMDKAKLESRIDMLTHHLARLDSTKDLQELIREIKRPGWTKPPEYLFTLGLVDSMIAQAKVLVEMRTVLLNGAKAVTQEKPAEALVG